MSANFLSTRVILTGMLAVALAVFAKNCSARVQSTGQKHTVESPQQNSSIQTRLKFVWGGTEKNLWQGRIQFINAVCHRPRVLGVEIDSSCSLRVLADAIDIAHATPTLFNGVEVDIDGDESSTVVVEISCDNGVLQQREYRLSDFLNGAVDVYQHGGARLSVTRAAGDFIPVKFERQHLVFHPGESFQFQFRTNHLPDSDSVEAVSCQLIDSSAAIIAKWIEHVVVLNADENSSGWKDAVCRIPAEEGIYRLRLSCEFDKWNTRSIQREIELVVIDPERTPLQKRSYDRLVQTYHPKDCRPNSNLRFDALSRWVGNSAGRVTGNFIMSADDSSIQLPVGGWQVLPLEPTNNSSPHLIEIEWLTTDSLTIGCSILQSDALDQINSFGTESGVYLPGNVIGGQLIKTGAIWKHRFVYWPSEDQDYLLISNRDNRNPAVFKKIRVFEGQVDETVASDIGNTTSQHRRALAFYEMPLFARNFGVSFPLDEQLRQPIADWNSFYQGALRLAQFLKDAGYRGCLINVVGEGSALTPLNSMAPSARFDSGVFSTSGRDCIPKDVVEMMYQIFDREGLDLVPAMTFDYRFADLDFDPKIENELVGQQGPVNDSGADGFPHYNPLSQIVQNKVAAVLREFCDRYRDRSNYIGVALISRPDTNVFLPGSTTAGFDSVTLGRFQRAHPQLKFSSSSFDDHIDQWLSWRAGLMKEFYSQLREIAVEDSPWAKLFLTLVDPFDSPGIEHELTPSLNGKHVSIQSLLQLGYADDLLDDEDSLIVSKPNKKGPTLPLSSFKGDYAAAESEHFRDFFRRADCPAELTYHRSSWARFQSLEDSNYFPNQTEPIVRLQEIAPGFGFSRKRFAESLLDSDVRLFFDGGYSLNTSVDQELVEFFDTFSQLPDLPFEDVPHESGSEDTHPVAVRTHVTQNRTWLYAVNGSPWQVNVQVLGEGPLIMESSSAGSATELSTTPETQITFDLEPFALTVFVLDPRSAIPERFKYQLPSTATSEINTKYYRVRSCLTACRQAKPIAVLGNPGFEGIGRTLNGWSTGDNNNNYVNVINRAAADGEKCLRIDNSDDRVFWIRSNEFDSPPTGRLSVSVWLKTDYPQNQPPLRICLESSNPDSNYYRFASVGSLATSPNMDQITGEWKKFAVHFDDVPDGNDTRLRVGFDLMGSGHVMIDNVEIYDRWMDGNDLKALTQMFASIGPLIGKQDKLEGCRRILAGYWPTFLLENFDNPPDQELALPLTEEQTAMESRPLRSSMRRRFRKLVSPGIFQFR